MNLIEALDDEAIFGAWLGDPSTWAAWRAILKGAFALPMTAAERRAFRKLAQRQPPKRRRLGDVRRVRRHAGPRRQQQRAEGRSEELLYHVAGARRA